MFIETIVKFFGTISISFKNSIYADVAKGFHEQHSLSLINLFYGFICGFYTFLFIMIVTLKYDRPREAIRELLKSFKYALLTGAFVCLVVIVVTIFGSFQATYVNKIATGSINSIEIISPYLDVQKTLELRSEFHRIKTAEDYNRFYEELNNLGEKHKINLPLLKPF